MRITREIGIIRSARRRLASCFAVAIFFALSSYEVKAASRIKDVATFEGVRDNVLVGYGLVAGLRGTGDDLKKIAPTKQSMLAMMERLGVNSRGRILDTANVAAVVVTAVLPPFGRNGSTIDIHVSSLGNAKSLQGGTLAVTPLIGADGEVYAVGQGSVEVGGFAAQGAAATVVQGVPTAGRIANGGIIEREVEYHLSKRRSVKLALRNPDFTTAQRICEAINAYFGSLMAVPTDPGSVIVTMDSEYPGSIVDLMTDIEVLLIEPDQPARVSINERTGVIVIGGDVRISSVAIAQGNLTISIRETPQVSQPAPFSSTGTSTVVPRTEIEVADGSEKRMAVVSEGISLQELVDGLNSLGVGPRDMISILQAIKAAGALEADLEVM